MEGKVCLPTYYLDIYIYIYLFSTHKNRNLITRKLICRVINTITPASLVLIPIPLHIRVFSHKVRGKNYHLIDRVNGGQSNDGSTVR